MSEQSGRARRAAAEADLAGRTDAPVDIVDYDPSWPARFAAERARLQPLLGADVEIHHIGSTAVPGLAAKPVIDLMVLVEDLDAHIAALVEAGYSYPAATNALLGDRRWLYRPSPQHRTHHLHLVSDRALLDRYLRFRDALRGDPRLAGEYARLKRDLAARHRTDRIAYSDAKTKFILGVP